MSINSLDLEGYIEWTLEGVDGDELWQIAVDYKKMYYQANCSNEEIRKMIEAANEEIKLGE